MIKKRFRDKINTTFPYVHSSKTDITKTFDRVRAKMEQDTRVKKASPVVLMRKAK